jgi:rhodanese-related sulfurtransferase
MRSSDPFIYAAGDATEIADFVSGRKTAVPLAGPANLQGRIAADNISGRGSIYQGAIGSSVIKVFDLTAAATGSNERVLKQLGQACRAAYAHPQSHASYYPGATPITLKLIYDEQGRVLGAQGIGQGVDKSIDVIAAVIKLKGRVSDLTHLELCYAPPFSSAKAPVNMVAYVAENTLNGLFNPITYEEYQGLDRAELTLLDVRFKAAYDLGHLEGAISLPLEELRSRIHELDREKPVVAYCTIGRRSYEAARILAHHGFQARSLAGGYTTASAQTFRPGGR